MKITAIISEYNPLHNGHLYQLNNAISDLKPDIKIAIMSGNFVQRGIMACLPKDIRAKNAIQAGFDVVIEIPTIFAVNNAECFSFGAINCIKNFPNTTLSFGSESGNINELIKVANTTKLPQFDSLVKQYLQEKNSYPTSVNLTIKSLLNLNTLDYSNNILAIEYIKAIEKLNKSISLHTVKRVDNYNNSNINKFMSATGIRELNNIEDAINFMPSYSYTDFISNTPNKNAYNNFALSKLFDIKICDLKEIFDVTEGLENRIKSALLNNSNYEDFINDVCTKRYSKSKINRIIINSLLSIKKEDVEKAKNIDYISILAINKDKLDLLSYLNNYTKIITKYADTKLLNENELFVYNIDKKANKLYELINNCKINQNMQII